VLLHDYRKDSLFNRDKSNLKKIEDEQLKTLVWIVNRRKKGQLNFLGMIELVDRFLRRSGISHQLNQFLDLDNLEISLESVRP
jgi:hypothetical protein